MSKWQYFSFLRARKWLLLAFTLGAGLLGTTLALTQPRQYQAEAQLVMDTRADPSLGGFGAVVGMSTQLEVLRSEKVAMRAAELLLTQSSPQVREQWAAVSSPGKALTQRGLAAFLLASSTADTVRGSNMIAIAVMAPSGDLAVSAANAMSQAATDVSLQLRVGPLRESADWLSTESLNLRAKLEEAQQKLSDYQRQNGIVMSDAQTPQEVARLNELEAALVAAESQLGDPGRRQGGLSENSPEVQQNASVQALRAQLAAAQGKLADMRIVLGQGHPQRLQQESQVAELKQQLADEIQRVIRRTPTSGRSSEQKVEQLRALAATQKQQVLTMRSQRDHIAMLKRDVDTAQQGYNSARQRAEQLMLESQNTQSGMRPMTPASDFTDRSLRKVVLKIAAAFVIGLAVAALLATALELRDWRVRVLDDLRMGPDVPVIGVLRPVGRKQPMFRGLPLDVVPILQAPSLPPSGFQP